MPVIRRGRSGGPMMHETRLGFSIATALVLFSASARGALAQTVAGTIRDSLKQAPVAGAIVQLVDVRDSVLAATRSAADGSFRFADVSTQDSTRRLRLKRLGFRPVTLPLGADLFMTALPVRAGRHRDHASLLSKRRRRRARAGHVDRRSRSLDCWNRIPRWDETDYARSRSAAERRMAMANLSTHPVSVGRTVVRGQPRCARAVSARTRTARRDTRSGIPHRTAAGPLLDPDFVATHCMHVERGRDAHRGELAIVFEPVRRNERPIEMTGTLWLDTNAALPRALSFEYLSPTVRDRKRAGATVTFSATRDGLPTVARWVMHLLPAHEPHPPQRARHSAVDDDDGDARHGRRFPARALGQHYEHARLGTAPHRSRYAAWQRRAIWRCARVGRARSSRVGGRRGHAFPLSDHGFTRDIRFRDSDTVLAVARRRHDVRGRASSRPRSSSGFDWDITTVREGERDGPPHGAFRAQSIPFDHDQNATISVGDNEDALRNACGLKRSRPDRWMIAGRVLTAPAADDPPTQAIVRARWLERSGENGRAREEVREQAADSLGYFRICKLPRGEPVHIEIADTGKETIVHQINSAQVVPLILRRNPESLKP